jgi:hypothetical protein
MPPTRRGVPWPLAEPRVETLGEPAIDWRQRVMRLRALALGVTEGTVFHSFRLLSLMPCESLGRARSSTPKEIARRFRHRLAEAVASVKYDRLDLSYLITVS